MVTLNTNEWNILHIISGVSFIRILTSGVQLQCTKYLLQTYRIYQNKKIILSQLS